MHVYKHFEFIFVAFATLFSTHFDKIITTDSPKSHNSYAFYTIFYQLYWQCLPIMLALRSILLLSYYAQNYAGVIGSSLVIHFLDSTHFLIVNFKTLP